MELTNDERWLTVRDSVLNIYTNERDLPIDKGYIEYNDAWFDSHIAWGNTAIDQTIRDIVQAIDGSIVTVDGRYIETRYGDRINISYLSTGCKTVINAYCFPNKLINCAEVGDNAFFELFKLTTGYLYVPIFPALTHDISNSFNFVIDGHEYRVSTYEEMLDIVRFGGEE